MYWCWQKHHVGSSSQVESFQQQYFCSPGVHRLSCSNKGINHTFHSNRHSINNLSTTQHFHLNNNFFVGPLNPFATSTMTPLSAYDPSHPCSIIDQQCLHRCPEIRVRTMKSKTLTVDSPTPTVPSKQQPQGRPQRKWKRLSFCNNFS